MKKILFLLCALLSIGASAQVSDSGPRKASANGHEYVDLGLPSGTLWATHNIGATNPEDYGNYYAWGETTTKSTYNWSTYKYSNGSNTTLTKYCTSSSYGTVDNKTELELSDDAAYVNWGKNWRMPSDDQFTELINSSYTTTTWTTVNGVYGRKITSKSNGNSIFLPAAGNHSGTWFYDAGSYGGYWSRTLDTSSPNAASNLGFDSSSISSYSVSSRFLGRSVRPVHPRILLVENITLTPTTLALAVGTSSQLSATVTPSDADNPALTWSSSDPSVAQVSSTGKVVGVSAGTCTVTCAATDGSGVKATCQVTVSDPDSHEYVDLGLPSGTLWATCNIGATNPEDYGDYFAWGETTGYNSGKTNFAWSTYKYCNGSSSTLTKYNNSSSYGTVDNKTELELADDAAYVNWGKNWRMPSDDQFTELINSSYTTTTWTTVNGVYGRKITSKSNGNSIFLPAAGYRNDTSLNNAGSSGFYWSRTLSTSYPFNARDLFFYSSNISANGYGRFYGQSVRPVLASILLVETITLTPASLALAMGATSQLTATVTPSGADNPALTWSSSDTEVAVVGTDGRVVAVAPGTAVITCAATDGSGVKATCMVAVTNPVPVATPYTVWCAANQTLYFTSRLDELAAGDTFTPEDGSAAQTVTAVWSGTDVTQSGSSMPQWWMTVYPTLTTAVVEPSFAEVRPASTAYWFFFCAGLTTLDLRNLNTSATTDMQGMFMNCTGLTTVLVDERWTTAAVTSSTNMFQNCTSIVGGNGTAYDASHIDHAYACIDTPTTPGYLTGVVPNVATLTDGEAYTLASDADYDRVDYVRTFTTTGWQALYVPFALSYADWAGDFEVARLNDIHQWDDDQDGEIDRTALEVILLTGGETVPHTPYLIRAKTAGEKTLTPTVPTLYAAEERSTDCSSFTTLFTVTGTYSGLSGAEMLSHGYYALGGGQLVQAASAESALKPMRWYVSVTDRDGNPKSLGEVKVTVFGEDGGELTSVGSVSRDAFAPQEDAPVFDLSGRRVAKPRKGIYVRGGRKYIVK